MASKMYNAQVPTITIDAATKRFPVPQTEHLRKHGLRSHPAKIPVFWPDGMQNASHLKKRIKKGTIIAYETQPSKLPNTSDKK
jgi:hypothetical protein